MPSGYPAMSSAHSGAKRVGGGGSHQRGLQPTLPLTHPQQALRASRLQELEPCKGQVHLQRYRNTNTNTRCNYLCYINANTNTRCNCFKQILPLVRELLAGERRSPAPGPGLVAANDRLLQLIIKVGFQRIFFKVLRFWDCCANNNLLQGDSL